MSWILRLMGLFYAATGFVYVRTYAVNAVADRLLEALDGLPAPKERIKRLWLTLGAALTVGSGLALLTLSGWILPFMVANAVVQGGWLLYARIAFPPEDEEDRAGRRQTTNAFLVWCVATAIALFIVTGNRQIIESGMIQTLLPPVGSVALFGWLMVQK
ncbi:MAG: hypothetical protein LCH47_08800 [Proteobacteria bacterium]|nr:hypothetical protein [Pseudomonadota bacterium]MCA0425697.1 hypothetical protein [Pseudomonadota bacterium]